MADSGVPEDADVSLASIWRVLGAIALVPFCGSVAVFAYAALGRNEVEDVSVLTADACLLFTIALIVALLPVIVMLVYYTVFGSFWLLIFVGCDDIPFSGWPCRVRIVLRSLVILACIAWIVATLPLFFMAPTWVVFRDVALPNVVIPASLILFLFLSRLEGRAEKSARATRADENET